MGDFIRNIIVSIRGFFNYNNVSVIDIGWNYIIPNIKLKHLPKVGEFINIGNVSDGYYRVINVIHVFTDKKTHFLVCEKVVDINNGEKVSDVTEDNVTEDNGVITINLNEL